MKRLLPAFIIVLTTEIIAAIICGPHSCEWGNSLYFYSGIVCAVLAFILPFFKKTFKLKKQLVYSLLFLLLTAIVWCAGFMLFGFRILCRLI
jgi:hypothetical protein